MASSDDLIMVSSDDEGDTFPDAVSVYCFQDKDHNPISFSKLPVQWNESESSRADPGLVLLVGKVDKSIGTFYQLVKAWKYDISRSSFEISVLSINNHWMKLKSPRTSYVNSIRSILISLHCLRFFKNRPDASGKSLWDYLSVVFSMYGIRPSVNDLIDQINLLREAVNRDETLSKSKFLVTFLENLRKKNILDEDSGAANQREDRESGGEEEIPFDSVCAICDNGGELICCEGKCFRSFHASKICEEAQESNCETLCLTPTELERQYTCENCKYNVHQCFVCSKLGSSDNSRNTEVFCCSSATCGHFYHPQCVAKLLQTNDTEQQTLKEKIAAGEPFICPVHKCAVCNQTENEKVEDLQFAICKRCPKSYHRKCLPRGIMFEYEVGDDYDGIRAWDGLLAKNRALIYCVDHDIDPDLGTPARTVIFRNILNIKTEQDAITSP